MFVTARRRRRGLASAVLAALEEHALRLGYTRLLLETGDRQRPALALYAKRNFQRIPAFGQYANDPTSTCFEKALGERET
jgi:GNAT superfamily N-acetyltransferase